MQVNATTAGKDVEFVDREKTGFNALTSETFLKLLVTQLQNQDPMEPVGNDELLNQLSAMRALQSNIELGESLKSVTLNQQLSSGAAFMGKQVTGMNSENVEVSGVVERVVVREGRPYVAFGNNELPIDKISSVEMAAS